MEPSSVETVEEFDNWVWDNPEKFVQILKNLHFTTFRFSVEWSNIEPREGEVD